MTVTPAAPTLEFYPLRARTLEVSRAWRLTPRMIRVTLTGEELEGFRTDNYADHVKVFFPDEETGHLSLPQVDDDGRWNVRAPHLVYRDYTVRRYDAAARELTIDFVAHDHGPAGRWAQRATPGDRVGVLGPRGTSHMAHSFAFYLLGADETALPAAARWLEELPRDANVFAFLEVADPGEEQSIEAPEHAEITWLHRNGAEAGDTALLEEAVRGVDLPESSGFAWCAGEATALKPIRGHLTQHGFVRGRTCDVDGYWRRGTSNHDHHEGEE